MGKEKEEIYSKIDEIPSGNKKGPVANACLVLEGGAMRGMYTEGVLDCLLEEDLYFGCVIGTSAGALNGLNYAAGHLGRAARMNLKYRHDSRYIGRRAYKNNRGFIGFDFMYKDYNEIEPWDQKWFNRPQQRFVAVVTNCHTGKTEYIEKGKCKDILLATQASASMPFVSKMVEMNGQMYLDGGCSCKVPYRWALHEKYKKIIVVRTRAKDYRKKMPTKMKTRLTYGVYRKYPKFAETLYHCNAKYNHQCDELLQLEKEGRIFVVEPSEPVTIGRLEKDVEKLGALYQLGKRDMKANLSALRGYLAK